MPPKKRNSQLKEARLVKKSKNNLFIQNTLSHDFALEIDDDKTICESDYDEIENTNEYELSDSDSDDDNWHSEALDNVIENFDASIFEVMMQNAHKKEFSTSNRPLVYIGNSERTTYRKKAQNRKDAANSMKLTSFFEKQNLNSLENNNDKNIYEEALINLNLIVKDKKLPNDIKKRASIISQYLNLRLAGKKSIEASLLLSNSLGGGEYRARLIRNWSKKFLKTSLIFVSSQGKHPKIKSLLWHEDINKKLKEYLLEQRSDVSVKKFKEYIENEVFPEIGIEEKKTISVKTVQVWLKKLGWYHQKHHKDIYYDGHEREDVIKYRKIFLSQMQEYEKLMSKPSESNILHIIEPLLNQGEKRYVLITHDECIFYANDGKKTFWGPPGHVPLRKKGMGLSLHVSDFLTEIDGRLKFGDEEACVIMKPGANREGWWTSEHLVKQVNQSKRIDFYFYFKKINYKLIYRSLKRLFQFLKNFILVQLDSLHLIMQQVTQLMPKML
jgi:hypothetical protein